MPSTPAEPVPEVYVAAGNLTTVAFNSMQVGFKDKALPAKAVLAVVSKADVMDGKVEVDRRANTPEALLAALTQKEAELEELKARYAGNGPASLVLSEWLDKNMKPVVFSAALAPGDASGLEVVEEGLVVVEVKAAPWTVGKPFRVELVGPSDQRRLSFNLVTQ